MISKLTHLLKYGFIGFLLGACLYIFVNRNEAIYSVSPLFIWAGIGALVGFIYSIAMERWFNGVYHD